MPISVYANFAEMEREYILRLRGNPTYNAIGEPIEIYTSDTVRGILTLGSRDERSLTHGKNTTKNMRIFRTVDDRIRVGDEIVDMGVRYRVVARETVGMGEVDHYKLTVEHYE